MIVSALVSVLLLTSRVVMFAVAQPPAAIAAPAAVLGIEVTDVPPTYPHRYQTAGAYVKRIVPNSPAEAARIVPGDVVVNVRGVAVTDHAGFRAATSALGTDAAVPIEIRRDGRSLTLNVTPEPANTLYAATPSSEPQSIGTELRAVAVSARRRDFENERVHGARALDLAETCASLEQKPIGSTLLNVGDAFSAMGAGAAGQTERDAANGFYGDAWVTYRLIASSSGMPGSDRQAATSKAAMLAKLVPSVANDGDPAIVDGLTYAGAALGAKPFTIVNTWQTSGVSYTRLLHVRVQIDTARDALLFASFFRVSAPSADGTDEVFFATDELGKPGPRIEIPGRATKAEIAPGEDFGFLKHAFVAEQTPATYVLTFVVSDNKADITNSPATLAYLPQ
jgi:hypothetical protein